MFRFVPILLLASLTACAPTGDSASSQTASPAGGGQASVKDDDSQPDVVKVAAGTGESFLKPENLSKLKVILQHHVTASALDLDYFENGRSAGMVDVVLVPPATWAAGRRLHASRLTPRSRASRAVTEFPGMPCTRPRQLPAPHRQSKFSLSPSSSS